MNSSNAASLNQRDVLDSLENGTEDEQILTYVNELDDPASLIARAESLEQIEAVQMAQQ